MKHSRYLFAILALLLLMVSQPSYAQAIPGCEAGNYNTMVNNGVLAGRREVAFNQAFIKKNDAVMDYACNPFSMETALADDIAPIFPETDVWANRPVELSVRGVTRMTEITFELGPDSMNNALANTVVEAANLYLDTNFNHTYLGGFSDIDPSGGCADMMPVWQQARDANFSNAESEIPGLELFYSYEEMIGYNPRIDPMDP
ncbi:MAG: hypothetical protein AAF569_00295 [Pseudomonadota bacterium]